MHIREQALAFELPFMWRAKRPKVYHSFLLLIHSI